MSAQISPRAERAAVRALAEAVWAARLDLCRGLRGPSVGIEERVDRLLEELWRERFGGSLDAAEVEGALRTRGLRGRFPAALALLQRPPSQLLAERLSRAHEHALTRRLVREGGRWALAESGTRRRQGVYYTPADVVAYVVEETLGRALAPWEAQLEGASPARRAQLTEQAAALSVLDPACGAGAFLLGALQRLRAFYAALGVESPGRFALEHNLLGLDLDGRALGLAELALLAAVHDEPGPAPSLVGSSLVRGDHLEGPALQRRLFPRAFERADPGFDVILGNPPYAPLDAAQRTRAERAGFRAAADRDIYALFVEGLETQLRAEGRGGLIVPLSVGYSRGLRAVREQVILTSQRAWRVASFDRIPSGLFDANVRTRTSIVFTAPAARDEPRLATTPLVRFSAADRARVFDDLRFISADGLCREDLGIPRLLSETQAEWLRRWRPEPQGRLGDGLAGRDAVERHPLHYKQNCYGFAIVSATLPPAYDANDRLVPQTKYSSLSFPSRTERDAALAVLAGRWLFWWWQTYGDGFDMTGQLIASFPVDPRRLSGPTRAALAKLGQRIQRRAEKHVAFKKNGGKRIGTFDLRACRDLTDEADALVAQAAGAEDLLADIRRALARVHGAG